MTVADLAPPLWAFYLPGKHDQLSHGGKGGFGDRWDQASTGRDALYDVDLLMDQNPGPDPIGGYSGTDVYRSFQSYRREGPEGFEAINDDLRASNGDRGALDDTLGGHVDRMDAAFAESHAASDLAVYRGIDDPEAMFGNAYSRSGNMTGMEWTDHGYTSTTADVEMVDRFTLDGGIQARLLVPEGTPAVTLSGAGRESEILLPRSSSFGVVADHGWTVNAQNENVRTIDVEVI